MALNKKAVCSRFLRVYEAYENDGAARPALHQDVHDDWWTSDNRIVGGSLMKSEFVHEFGTRMFAGGGFDLQVFVRIITNGDPLYHSLNLYQARSINGDQINLKQLVSFDTGDYE